MSLRKATPRPIDIPRARVVVERDDDGPAGDPFALLSGDKGHATRLPAPSA